MADKPIDLFKAIFEDSSDEDTEAVSTAEGQGRNRMAEQGNARPAITSTAEGQADVQAQSTSQMDSLRHPAMQPIAFRPRARISPVT